MSRRPQRLARFLAPRSVAVVGASERQGRSNNAVGSMLEAGVQVHLVNPNRYEAYGRPTFPSLADLPEPVDAVLSLVPAEASVDVVASAAASGAGGVVVIAGGFAESGPAGAELQERLLESAGDMPVLGPNCNGFVRPSTGARLSGTPRWPFPGGTLGIVSHSGAMLGPVGLAARERGIGISSYISTGNEMAVDMAECLEFLAVDDETRCIGLVVETIRSSERFFAAVRLATERGKPIVALKLGRSARGKEIATSHTGALAGEAWIYDAAFRQHGMGVAEDLTDLLDRLTLCAQLPLERWTPVRGIAVATLSGGFSALASDVCETEGVHLPDLQELSATINALIPDRTTINPLDMTGFVMGKADVVEAVVSTLSSADSVDAVLLHWPLVEEGAEPDDTFRTAAVAVSGEGRTPVVLWSLDDGRIGSWASDLVPLGVGVSRGIRPTVRALRTMGDFVAHRERARAEGPVAAPTSVARPDVVPVPTVSGDILPFETVMELLRSAGIPVAPFAIVEADADAPGRPAFDGPYVVKLADVAHRSDIGAVRLGVAAESLAIAVDELRSLAAAEDVPARVVIQPMVRVLGEAFLGVEAASDLGPLVLFGVGGVFVELLGRVAGGIAPLSPGDARRMVEELADTGVFDGARGAVPWPKDQLEELVVALGRLAVGASDWLGSLDINPLALTDHGFVAVDGLCFLRTS